MSNEPVVRVRGVPWPAIVSVLCLMGAVWWIYPFFNLKINPVFNSDSAMTLTAITEHVPLAENIFQWGGARTGLALGALGWIFFRIFGAGHLTDFLGVANAVLFVIGCSVFARARFRGRNSYILVPAGLLLVLANFNTPLTSISFAFTVTDIAHRPEIVPLLVLLSWVFLLLGEEQAYGGRRWWILSGSGLLLGMVATWVSDVALIAGLILVCLGLFRARVLRARYPWEIAVIWLASVATLKLLRKISVYGGGGDLLYQLPSREDIRLLLGTALHNLWSLLTPATWGVVGLIALSLAICLARDRRVSGSFLQERALWHSLGLLTIGIVALLVPLGSKWVFLSSVHPRYFSPGALLLCLGAAQGEVCLLERLLRPPQRPLAGAAIVALLVIPLAWTGAQTAKVRRDMLAAGTSAAYRAGEIIIASDVRAIVGSFWDSYVYVLARPGFLKAAPTQTVSRISVSNTLTVLGMSRLAWIERDPAKFQPIMKLRGVEFTEADNQPPVPLPTGAYFKRYTPTGRVRLEFGSPECQIYLREGWSAAERDASHSWSRMIGGRAVLELPLRGEGTYEMEVLMNRLEPSREAVEITVVSMGQPLGTVSFAGDKGLKSKLILPPQKGGTGPRRIEFRLASDVTLGTIAFEQAHFLRQQ